jgi:glutamine synthetase
MPPSDPPPAPPVLDLLGTGPGRGGFIERHALWTDTQYAAAAQAQRVIDEVGIELVRVSFPDQHGLLRGKTLTREAFANALRSGVTAPSSLVVKDTACRTIYSVFEEGAGAIGMPQMEGAGDLLLVPDPTTFRVLPWAPRTAWVLSDIHFPDGSPVPFSTRHLYRGLLDDLALRGYQHVVGLEVEFHVFRPDGAPLGHADIGQPGSAPGAGPTSRGYQLLLEESIDPLDEIVQALRDTLTALDLPLVSIEHEFGPSQLELTFAPQTGLRAADDMVLCRSAVKQVCRRLGYHATFMCRPAFAGVASSGWHLHQSLRELDGGGNAFMADPGSGDRLSALARGYLGGLLAHARGAAVFTTPTINGYKRYRPHSLAPDRILWGEDNKGAMIRVVGGPGDAATRLENRSGEPAANPYLYMASQLVCGLDGVDRDLDPGVPTTDPYGAAADRLPASLMDALRAFQDDPVFAQRMGQDFADYVVALKTSEIDRYLQAVTDWEQREYFELF